MIRLTMMLGFLMFSGWPSFAQDRNPDRFEDAIKTIEKRISDGVSKRGEVLFIGSSSIRLWDLEESFPKCAYNNHGFGGSEISDSVHFFDRIVVPVEPSAIVFYAGDNDIAGSKSPETVAADFRIFLTLVEQKCPQCQAVLFIGIKPSLKRWELREAQKKANDLVKGLLSDDSKLHFVDVWDHMLGTDGLPRKEMFVKDGLHLSPDGYVVWTKLVQEELDRARRPASSLGK